MLTIPRAAGIRIHHGEQRSFARQSLWNGPAGGDREDRTVAVRRRGERVLPILEDHGVGERPERGEQRPLQARLGPDEILQHAGGAATVRLQEARPRGLLDVAPARVQQLEARLLPPLDVVELLHLLDRAAPFVLELCATLGERRRLAVEALDVRLDPFAFGPERGEPIAHAGELRFEAVSFPLARGDRALQRLDLDPASDGLLARSAAELVDLPSMLVCLAERRLRLLELVLPVDELTHGPLEVRLDASELGLDRVDPGRAPRLGGERLTRHALEIESAAERLLRFGPVRLRVPEPELDVGEPASGGGSSVRPSEHLGIQRIEPGAGLLPLREAFVPAALPPFALGEQTPEPGGRELAGELLRLSGQRLVFLCHLRLLSERLELAAELGHHVLEPEQIVVQARELALRAFLAAAMLRDARRFLDVLPAVLRPGEEDLLELALAHHRVERPADPGFAQQLLDVEQADELPVDPVLAVARTEDRAAHLDLGHRHRDQASLVVDHELDLGHPERGPARRPGEDHVGHLTAAERPRALFPEGPTDRVDEVRLPGTVGTHDHADAGHELKDGLVREGLEPADLDLSQEHAARC